MKFHMIPKSRQEMSMNVSQHLNIAKKNVHVQVANSALSIGVFELHQFCLVRDTVYSYIAYQMIFA